MPVFENSSIDGRENEDEAKKESWMWVKIYMYLILNFQPKYGFPYFEFNRACKSASDLAIPERPTNSFVDDTKTPTITE